MTDPGMEFDFDRIPKDRPIMEGRRRPWEPRYTHIQEGVGFVVGDEMSDEALGSAIASVIQSRSNISTLIVDHLREGTVVTTVFCHKGDLAAVGQALGTAVPDGKCKVGTVSPWGGYAEVDAPLTPRLIDQIVTNLRMPQDFGKKDETQGT